MTEKMTITKGYKLLLDALQPISISKSDRIPRNSGILQTGSDEIAV